MRRNPLVIIGCIIGTALLIWSLVFGNQESQTIVSIIEVIVVVAYVCGKKHAANRARDYAWAIEQVAEQRTLHRDGPKTKTLPTPPATDPSQGSAK